MPGETRWDNDEKTILLHVYSGDVILQDYFDVIDKSKQMTESVPHTVHVILDRTTAESQPPGLSAALRYANKHIPSNQGIRVVVGGNRFTRLMVDIGRVVAPHLVKDVYFADTLDEARALIQSKAQQEEVRKSG